MGAPQSVLEERDEDEIPTKVDPTFAEVLAAPPRASDIREIKRKPELKAKPESTRRPLPPRPPARPAPMLVPPLPPAQLVTTDLEVIEPPPPPISASSVKVLPPPLPAAGVAPEVSASLGAEAKAEPQPVLEPSPVEAALPPVRRDARSIALQDWLAQARRLRAVTSAMTVLYFIGYAGTAVLRATGKLLVRGATHLARWLEVALARASVEWARAKARVRK